ncbi:ATP-binding protein [Corynebacterium auris]|uniref:ATP-binding protein n=1 Tax=Corynebacterium auris TaxID=44750 RepID=UPI0025B5D8C2|nr:ATP-binding protein [Corynebacterium auris]WJY68509.1 transposase/IS protein [Corynebacterium auris]
MPHPQPASASARFLDESVLPVFTDLRMTAFGQSVIDIAADPAFDDWSFSDKVLYALDKEVAAKRERRVNKLLKASRSPNPDACIEDITYTPGRTINKEQITRLAHCRWCQSAQNIVILGKSSVGKTYLAQALLTAACRNDYSARFFRTDTLSNHLAVLKHDDPARITFLEDLHHTDVLVLDDFLSSPEFCRGSYCCRLGRLGVRGGVFLMGLAGRAVSQRRVQAAVVVPADQCRRRDENISQPRPGAGSYGR